MELTKEYREKVAEKLSGLLWDATVRVSMTYEGDKLRVQFFGPILNGSFNVDDDQVIALMKDMYEHQEKRQESDLRFIASLGIDIRDLVVKEEV